MPKFLHDGHFSGSSTDLTVDGNITGSGNLHLSHANQPTLQLTDTTNGADFKIRAANNYIQLQADSTNSVGSSRIQFQVDGSTQFEVLPSSIQINGNSASFIRADASGTSSFGLNITTRKQSGNTYVAGDDVGRINFRARDNVLTSDTVVGSIITEADNTFTSSDAKTRMKMQVRTGSSLDNVLFLDSDKSATFYGNILISGNTAITSGRNFYGTIFYDADNTSYYLNPASTSELNAANFAGVVTASGQITGASVSAAGGFLNGSNGGIRIHSGGTKFFNVTAANVARDNIMDIGASDARFKDLHLGGNINVSGTVDGVDISGLPSFTTVGTNFAQLGNVSVASYIRVNANETLSYLNASQFLSAIGGVDGSAYLPLAGGKMTGNLEIEKQYPVIILDDSNATNPTNAVAYISYQINGSEKAWTGWGSNSTNDFTINAGAGSDLVLRSNNSPAVTFNSSQNANFTGGITAPSLVATDVYAQNIYITSSGTSAVNRIDNDTSSLYITYGGTSSRALSISNSNGNVTFGDDVNIQYDNISTSNSGTVVYGGFLNPASEANMVHLPHVINDLAGFNKWSNATITTSGFYKTRSGSSGSYTYSNEVTNTDGGWANAFDAHSSTAGSWYSDNGSDGTYTHGVDTPGVVELQWTNEATYSLWAGIVFGSNSFTATYVKIEAYRGGAWQTLCEITNNTDQVILRQVSGNSGTGAATTRLKYTLGGSVNNSYFRIHSLYMANYRAGDNNLNNTSTDSTRGVNFLERYKNNYAHGHFYPGANNTYDIGSSSYKWNNVNAVTLNGNLVGTIHSNTTANTQSQGNNSTKVATTAYVDTAVSNLVDSAPSTLDTLNELAAALGDDANFSTTVTNSIAGKVSKSGDTMTGGLTIGSAGSGHDVKFFGDLSGEYFMWDENVSTVNIYHRDELPGLEVYVNAGAQTTQPQLKVGRSSVQYWGAYVDDRNAHLVHRQDETSGIMTTRFDQWDSNTSDNTGQWQWRSGDGSGSSMTTAAVLYQDGDFTVKGDLMPINDGGGSLGGGSGINLRWGGLELQSGAGIQWQNGDARIIEGLVNNYSLSFQTYDGSSMSTALRLDGNNNANFEGHVKIASGKYLEFAAMGKLINMDVPGWASGVQEHNILYSGWTGSTGDYLSLKVAGNSTAGHGNLIIGDNGLWYGTMDTEDTAQATDSTTNPNGNTNRFRVDNSGNGTFAGTISSLRLTIGEIASNAQIESNTNSLFLKAGNVQIQGNLIPDADSSRNLGATNRYWENAYIDQITTTGNATFGGNIALGGGALKTYHSNVTSVIALDDNGSIFTRADETYIGHNIYYDSGDEGTAIEAGYSTLLRLTEGEFYIYGTAASVSADATTSIQERFKIDTSGNATFGGDVTVEGKAMINGTSGSSRTALHVMGDDTSPDLSSAAVDDLSLILSNSDAAYGMMFSVAGTGTGYIQQRRVSSTTSYALAIQPYGGNLGIGGEVTPLSKLEVSGSIKATNRDSAHTSEAGLTMSYDTTNAIGLIETWTSKPLMVRTYNYQSYDISGTERLRINSSGISVTGSATATSFVKSGGTSSQFLMADGSVSTGGGDGDDLGNHTATQALDMDGNNITDAGTINAGGGVFQDAITIDSDGSTDNYYLNFNESGSNRFTIYENSNNVYFNGWAGHTIFRPQMAGSGSFAVIQGNNQMDTSGNAHFVSSVKSPIFYDTNTSYFVNPAGDSTLNNASGTFFRSRFSASSNMAVGWYTIAVNPGNRAQGRFRLTDRASSRHQAVEFLAAHHYGNNDSNTITVLDNSTYSTDVFRYIRIKDGSTYEGAAIQVYIDNATNICRVILEDQAWTDNGWILKNFVADASDPGDVGNYSNLSEQVRVDLDDAKHNGGINTTGKGHFNREVTSENWMKATQFYDYNNTNYYVDPASTSVVNHMGMVTGNTSGKFAVMSSGVHGSYDFYNNGTSYFNGAVTVDDNLSITSGVATITQSATNLLTLINSSNGGGAGIVFNDNSGGAQRIYLRGYHADGSSQGGGASLHLQSTENDLVFVVGDSSNTGRIAVQSAHSTAEVDYGFYSDINTGIYSPAAGQVGLVSDSSRKLLVSSNGVTINNGNLYVPDYIYHADDTDTYIRFTNNAIALRAAGNDLLICQRYPASGGSGVATSAYAPQGLVAENLGGANLIKKGTDVAVSGVREEVTWADGVRKVQAHASTGNGNSSSCYNWYSSENVRIDPEKDYEFSVWIKSTGDDHLYLGWHEYKADGTKISSNPYFHTSKIKTHANSNNTSTVKPNIEGWVLLKYQLKSHRTTSGQSDTEGTDRFASNGNPYQTSGATGVMHSTTTHIHLRLGTCYGSVNGSKSYFYNPKITEAQNDDIDYIHKTVETCAKEKISVPQGKKILFDGRSGHTYINEESDSNLKFYVGGTERMNVSGGSTYVQQKLHVAGDININDNDLINDTATVFYNRTSPEIDYYDYSKLVLGDSKVELHSPGEYIFSGDDPYIYFKKPSAGAFLGGNQNVMKVGLIPSFGPGMEAVDTTSANLNTDLHFVIQRGGSQYEAIKITGKGDDTSKAQVYVKDNMTVSGKFGIGTTDPKSPLSVNGVSSLNGEVILTQNKALIKRNCFFKTGGVRLQKATSTNDELNMRYEGQNSNSFVIEQYKSGSKKGQIKFNGDNNALQLSGTRLDIGSTSSGTTYLNSSTTNIAANKKVVFLDGRDTGDGLHFKHTGTGKTVQMGMFGNFGDSDRGSFKITQGTTEANMEGNVRFEIMDNGKVKLGALSNTVVQSGEAYGGPEVSAYSAFNTTNPTCLLYHNYGDTQSSSSSLAESLRIQHGSLNSNTGYQALITFRSTTNAIRGKISGRAAGVAYYTGSDARLKEDPKDFDGLNLIEQFKPYDFKWIDLPEEDRPDGYEELGRDYGLYAQEAKDIVPNAVDGDGSSDEMMQMDYSKLVPVLIKAVQQLSAKVKELESKIQ